MPWLHGGASFSGLSGRARITLPGFVFVAPRVKRRDRSNRHVSGCRRSVPLRPRRPCCGRQIRRSDRGPPSERRAGAYDPVGSSCYGPSLLVIANVAIAPEPRRVRRAAPATSPGGPRDRHASDAPWTAKSMRPLAAACQDSRCDSGCDFTLDRLSPPDQAVDQCQQQAPRSPRRTSRRPVRTACRAAGWPPRRPPKAHRARRRRCCPKTRQCSTHQARGDRVRVAAAWAGTPSAVSGQGAAAGRVTRRAARPRGPKCRP